VHLRSRALKVSRYILHQTPHLRHLNRPGAGASTPQPNPPRRRASCHHSARSTKAPVKNAGPQGFHHGSSRVRMPPAPEPPTACPAGAARPRSGRYGCSGAGRAAGAEFLQVEPPAEPDVGDPGRRSADVAAVKSDMPEYQRRYQAGGSVTWRRRAGPRPGGDRVPRPSTSKQESNTEEARRRHRARGDPCGIGRGAAGRTSPESSLDGWTTNIPLGSFDVEFKQTV
jgi:hypothetical protein